MLWTSVVQLLELLSCMIQCLGGSGWSKEFLEGLNAWPLLLCLLWLPNTGYLGCLPYMGYLGCLPNTGYLECLPNTEYLECLPYTGFLGCFGNLRQHVTPPWLGWNECVLQSANNWPLKGHLGHSHSPVFPDSYAEMFPLSQFPCSGIQAGLTAPSALGLNRLQLRIQPDSILTFQAHADGWQNSVPCHGRLEPQFQGLPLCRKLQHGCVFLPKKVSSWEE